MYRVEDVEKLQKALKTYHDELVRHEQTIRVAADLCDQAMGSDANAQRHIGKLQESLKGLQKAVKLSEQTYAALEKDKKLALDTMNQN